MNWIDPYGLFCEGGDIPEWQKWGFSSEEEYLMAGGGGLQWDLFGDIIIFTGSLIIVRGGKGYLSSLWDLYNNRKKINNPYTPDRELPKDSGGQKVPDSEFPHTQLGKKQGSKGEYPQTREWGDATNRGYDGKTPQFDIDWTDHGRGDHNNPHIHPYDQDTGKRLSGQ